MATVQYIRCDHGQWLQDGPCKACEARAVHHKFSIPPHQREWMSDRARITDEISTELTALQKSVRGMSEALDKAEADYYDGMYLVITARIRRLANDL